MLPAKTNTGYYGDIMSLEASHVLDIGLDHGAFVGCEVKCKDLEVGLVEKTKDSNNV